MWAMTNTAHTRIQTTCPSFRRAHVHPDTNAFTRSIRQLGHLATTVIQIGHAIAVDALLVLVVVARLATLHRVFVRRQPLSVAAHALLMTDGATHNRAGHRGLVAVVTMSDVVAD